MTTIVKLDTVDHAALTVAVRHGAAFGDAVNQVVIFPNEFEQVQRDLPILFRRDDAGGWYAVALTGLDRDENLMLDERGWTTRYVPALRRLGPFTSRSSTGEQLPSIHIDLDDPRVGDATGEPLFLRHGGTAPYLRQVTKTLEVLRDGHAAAAPTYAALIEHSLLKPVVLDIEIDDGLSYRINDVFTIDTERMAALDDATLVTLHRSGVICTATMASVSLGNVARLIELKRARMRS